MPNPGAARRKPEQGWCYLLVGLPPMANGCRFQLAMDTHPVALPVHGQEAHQPFSRQSQGKSSTAGSFGLQVRTCAVARLMRKLTYLEPEAPVAGMKLATS